MSSNTTSSGFWDAQMEPNQASSFPGSWSNNESSDTQFYNVTDNSTDDESINVDPEDNIQQTNIDVDNISQSPKKDEHHEIVIFVILLLMVLAGFVITFLLKDSIIKPNKKRPRDSNVNEIQGKNSNKRQWF